MSCSHCRYRHIVTAINVSAGTYLGLTIFVSLSNSIRMRDKLNLTRRLLEASKDCNNAVKQVLEKRASSDN